MSIKRGESDPVEESAETPLNFEADYMRAIHIMATQARADIAAGVYGDTFQLEDVDVYVAVIESQFHTKH